MIEARIRFEGDGAEVADGACQIPAIPPIGGHISIIDKNGNRCVLRVTDVVIGAASNEALEVMPKLMASELKITIFGQEAFGHFFSDPGA
jgi:hypothetical protein